MKRPQPQSSLSASFYMREFARSFLKKKRLEHKLKALSEVNNENEQGMDLLKKYDNPLIKKFMKKNTMIFKNKKDFLFFVDQREAIKSVKDIIDHLRREDEEKRVYCLI
jgi:hypothetical protein